MEIALFQKSNPYISVGMIDMMWYDGVTGKHLLKDALIR